MQEYIVKIDPYKFNLIKEGYEDICFEIDYKEVINNDGVIYLVIEEKNVIGLIIGVVRKPVVEYDYARRNNMGEVTELIVTKNIRSKGVGKQLIKNILKKNIVKW